MIKIQISGQRQATVINERGEDLVKKLAEVGVYLQGITINLEPENTKITANVILHDAVIEAPEKLMSVKVNALGSKADKYT